MKIRLVFKTCEARDEQFIKSVCFCCCLMTKRKRLMAFNVKRRRKKHFTDKSVKNFRERERGEEGCKWGEREGEKGCEL